jgi:hypothetical protein
MRSTRGRRACAPGARMCAKVESWLEMVAFWHQEEGDTLHIQYSPDPLASVMFKMYSCISLVSSSFKLANRLAEYCKQC